ncbi:MAG: hypothetical protein IJ303_01610 [Clostridia bacterium]|nr:hypothetical protein [Clostridia bacterium]
MTFSEVIKDEHGGDKGGIVALSGPTHAEKFLWDAQEEHLRDFPE